MPQEWQVCITCAFMHAFWMRRFAKDKTRDEPLTSGYTRATVNDVAATMPALGHRDPQIDGNDAVHLAIKQQTRGYHKTDPNVKHQKALPIRIYEQVNNQEVNDLDKAIAYLLSGALFFAMRSCEYSATSRSTEQRTKTISVQNLRFYKHKRILHLQSKKLSQADTIALTFEDQKMVRNWIQ